MRDESRDRLLVPLMVPLLAVVIIVVLVLAFSRILLAVEPEYATPIALAMALNVLTAGALIASVPRLRGKPKGRAGRSPPPPSRLRPERAPPRRAPLPPAR